MYQKTTLENGLRIVSQEMPHTYSVSTALFFGVGSRDEPDSLAGISHMIEHMLFKGTPRRPTAKEVAEAIEEVGGVMNAGTEREITNYWVKVTANHRPLALDLLSDITRHAKFERDEVSKERKVIIEEIHMSNDVPSELAHLMIDELIWPNHALGRDIAGSAESVGNLDLDAILDFYHRAYVPNNLVIAVAGATTHADVVEECKRYFGDWAPGPPLPVRNGVPKCPPRPASRVLAKETEQTHTCLSGVGLPRNHSDRRAQDVQNLILGGGMSSRLFLEIREKRALAYDVHSYVEHLSDTGATVLYAGTDPDQAEPCVRAMLDQLARMREELVPESELRKAREYFRGRMLLGLEDSASVTSWLGGQELLNSKIQSVEDVTREIDAVQAADILRVSQQCLGPDQLCLASVGPARTLDVLQLMVERHE
jgi:predicted Zn-dependent peptidase